ncbi:hypothetical protein B0H13DRAFT_2358541 [Mycena leptocephala]|nr:hypothetical protein B0H13DRAFT_2358541 [Mycena leptocephala]
MHWAAFSAGLRQREADFLAGHAFIVEIELAKDVRLRTPASRASSQMDDKCRAYHDHRCPTGGGANLQMSREVLEEVDGEMYYCCDLPKHFGPFIQLLTLPGYETPTDFTRLTAVDLAMMNRGFQYNIMFMDDPTLINSPSIWNVWVDRAPTSGWAVTTSSDPPAIAPRLCETDLHPLVHFYNYNFTVDADDNYRVIILRDMGEAHKLLPMHLPRHYHDTDDDTFFRLHLRASMSFMLLGGDISENDSDGEMAPLSDERWHTELGEAILAGRSIYYSEQSDSDDSESDSDVALATSVSGPVDLQVQKWVEVEPGDEWVEH